MSHTRALNKIMYIAMQERQRAVADYLRSAVGCTVQGGPFQGMALPDDSSWGVGDLAPKILGCYEGELHGSVNRAIGRRPELVVNVGCAEGYYAIGLARLLPGVPVHAFDLDEKALAVCQQAAEQNGVGGQLTVGGRCDLPTLCRLVEGKRALVVMDCEGGERDLLTPASLGALAQSDLIVENHDFIDRSISTTLTQLFNASHDLKIAREGMRDPAAFPFMRKLNGVDRMLAVCEFRPEVMTWLIAWSKQRPEG